MASVESQSERPRPIPGVIPASVAQTKRDLAAGLRILEQQGQADLAAGFLIARSPEDEAVFLASPHGVFWREVVPEDFCAYSWATGRRSDGAEGPLPNAPVCPLAAAIFAACPDVKAICHAHGPGSMAVSACKEGLLPMSEASFMFYERVKFIRCDFFFEKQYCSEVAELLRDEEAFVVLARNHSFFIVGASIQQCFMRAYMFEQACRVQLQILGATKDPYIPDRDEILYHRRSYEGYPGCPAYNGQFEWPGLLRKLREDNGLEWCA
ncbi:unnamed protein product [Polarella glacialis]|uniref:Class II aldolase/adducin N-terminal domain-containing protein n=1 Tax=Polarella glacialis TaxID=89957 RepID=A0A813KYJ9_POLGL|nr:unnamed protein product [Polarella glacialis]